MKKLIHHDAHHDDDTTLNRHDDLDYLAGTWSEEDVVAFEHSTAGFNEIEASLWKGDKLTALL